MHDMVWYACIENYAYKSMHANYKYVGIVATCIFKVQYP